MTSLQHRLNSSSRYESEPFILFTLLRGVSLDQWCLRTLLGIKWHRFLRNEEVRRITNQPYLTAIIQSQRLSIFGHISCMDGDADAKMILIAPVQRTGRDHHRASPYHVAEHHPVRPESLQPHTERSSRPGPEPPSVEADVYVWRYALLVVHTRKEAVLS